MMSLFTEWKKWRTTTSLPVNISHSRVVSVFTFRESLRHYRHQHVTQKLPTSYKSTLILNGKHCVWTTKRKTVDAYLAYRDVTGSDTERDSWTLFASVANLSLSLGDGCGRRLLLWPLLSSGEGASLSPRPVFSWGHVGGFGVGASPTATPSAKRNCRPLMKNPC